MPQNNYRENQTQSQELCNSSITKLIKNVELLPAQILNQLVKETDVIKNKCKVKIKHLLSAALSVVATPQHSNGKTN